MKNLFKIAFFIDVAGYVLLSLICSHFFGSLVGIIILGFTLSCYLIGIYYISKRKKLNDN